MKIRVDWGRCEGNAVCVRVAPEAFRVDEDDKLHLIVTDVPAELEDKVKMAARRCPKRAIFLDE